MDRKNAQHHCPTTQRSAGHQLTRPNQRAQPTLRSREFVSSGASSCSFSFLNLRCTGLYFLAAWSHCFSNSELMVSLQCSRARAEEAQGKGTSKCQRDAGGKTGLLQELCWISAPARPQTIPLEAPQRSTLPPPSPHPSTERHPPSVSRSSKAPAS